MSPTPQASNNLPYQLLVQLSPLHFALLSDSLLTFWQSLKTSVQVLGNMRFLWVFVCLTSLPQAGCSSSGGGDVSGGSTQTAPLANAGPDKTVFTGQPLSLDGSGSSDANGDPLTYQWTLTTVPPGSGALLTNPTSMQPSFTPDLVGTYLLTLVVNDGKANSQADTATIQVWQFPSYLKASNTERQDKFGWSVALDGDTLAIGSIEGSNATGVDGNQVDNSAPQSGAVYVFARTNGVWSQQAYLKASNTGAGDYFGTSVALHGDTLVVGAYQEDSAATGVNGDQTSNTAQDSGAVYVFTRTNGVWSQQAYIKASNTEANDFFGQAVSLHGDTLAVGAYLESSAATGINGDQSSNAAPLSGAVYVFTRTNGAWSQQAYIKASNTQTNDFFGIRVALYGDTLAVSASGEDSSGTGVNGNQADNGAPQSGAVYVFTRTNGVWSQQAYLKASNTDIDDNFGSDSIALNGDTLAVGVTLEDSSANGVNGDQSSNNFSASGAAYVFIRTNGAWSQEAYLKASNAEAFDGFGTSVAIMGDTLAVGAQGEASSAIGLNGDQINNGAAESGAVYLFNRTGGVWRQQTYLKAPDNTEAQVPLRFGQSIGLQGSTLAVAAPFEDSAATGVDGNQSDNSADDSGAVFVYSLP